MHRCRLVAEGIAEAWSEGRRDLESLRESVERRFAVAGLSLDRPHLNPGGEDIYILDSP